MSNSVLQDVYIYHSFWQRERERERKREREREREREELEPHKTFKLLLSRDKIGAKYKLHVVIDLLVWHDKDLSPSQCIHFTVLHRQR